jgi:hypothetical protein
MIGLITDLVNYLDVPRISVKTDEIDPIVGSMNGIIRSVMVGDGGFAYEFMNKEVFETLGSILNIVNPKKEYLKKELASFIETREEAKSSGKGDKFAWDEVSWDDNYSKIIPFLEEFIKNSE